MSIAGLISLEQYLQRPTSRMRFEQLGRQQGSLKKCTPVIRQSGCAALSHSCVR